MYTSCGPAYCSFPLTVTPFPGNDGATADNDNVMSDFEMMLPSIVYGCVVPGDVLRRCRTIPVSVDVMNICSSAAGMGRSSRETFRLLFNKSTVPYMNDRIL